MEYEVCKFLHMTPMQVGELRRKDPAGVRFIELTMVHRSKEQEKQQKEMERKSKAKRGKHR